MAETYSTPEQAEELADALHALCTHSRVYRQPGSGDYAQRSILFVPVPDELKPYLPHSTHAPDDTTVTIKVPLHGSTPPPSLRLSWEYNPLAQIVEIEEDVGSYGRDKAEQRGFLFKSVRATRNPSMILGVSGLYDQLPSSHFPPSNAGHEKILQAVQEGADLLRIAADKAEMTAWSNAEAGITDPRVTFDKAAVLIGFVQALPQLGR